MVNRTSKIATEFIDDQEMLDIPNPKAQAVALEHLMDITGGKRDFRF